MRKRLPTRQLPEVQLEPLEAKHADKLFDGLSDPGLYGFISDDPPESLEWLRTRYAALAKRRPQKGAASRAEIWRNWAVWAPDDAVFVGYTQATIGADGIAELGYVLFRAFWSLGYGQAAIVRTLELLRSEHSVTEFLARVDTRNASSKRLLKRLGFRCVGTHAEAEWIDGRLTDEAIYKLSD